MRFVSYIALFLMGFTLQATPSYSCSATPSKFRAHHTELIAESQTIVLARVIGRTDKTVSGYANNFPAAVFETIEALRGNPPERFTVPNGVTSSGYIYSADNDFDRHEDPIFWDKFVTRAFHAPDCKLYPYFDHGREYLIFLDHPHYRAYEEIAAPDDLWLQVVRRLIADPNDHSLTTMKLDQWIRMSTGAFVGKVQSCTGPIFRVDEVLHGSFEKTWRYADHNDRYYRPVLGCKVGQTKLVVTYLDEPYSFPEFSSTLYPIDDRKIDFTQPRHRSTELNILGPEIVNLNDLRTMMRGRAQ